MDELSLYKFVKENELEWQNTNDDIILFVNNYLLDEWNKLLGNAITDESGLGCVMKDGYFCFMMIEICDFFGVEVERVFLE